MKQRTLMCLFTAALICGCGSTTTIDDFRPTNKPIDISMDQKVAVLGRRDAGHFVTDREFIECIGRRMAKSKFLVMSESEFVDALYPWFEPRTAPKHLKRLKRIMQVPAVRQKVEAERISHLVWIEGEVESHGATGAMTCGFGPAGTGCFGYTAWDKNVMFEAVVWDLTDLAEEARIRVDSEGTSYVIGIVAPIPLLTPVEREACEGMGNQLLSYFSQEED